MKTITLPRDVVEQALEALCKAKRQVQHANVAPHGCTGESILALRAALANAEQAKPVPQGDRAELIHSLRTHWVEQADEKEIEDRCCHALGCAAADMLEADHIPDAGKMMHCERCGAELMSDMTTICYQCNQD